MFRSGIRETESDISDIDAGDQCYLTFHCEPHNPSLNVLENAISAAEICKHLRVSEGGDDPHDFDRDHAVTCDRLKATIDYSLL